MKSLKSANFSSTIDKILRFALSKVKFSSISEEKFANFNVKAENSTFYSISREIFFKKFCECSYVQFWNVLYVQQICSQSMHLKRNAQKCKICKYNPIRTARTKMCNVFAVLEHKNVFWPLLILYIYLYLFFWNFVFFSFDFISFVCLQFERNTIFKYTTFNIYRYTIYMSRLSNIETISSVW